MKQALKIKLANHSEFQQAWGALIKLGYHCHKDLVPHTAPYLYTYEDGRILADYFDVEGADLSNSNSAAGSFTESEHEEITVDALLGLAKQGGHEPFYDYIPLIKQERPLFEDYYVKNGGDLQFLKWEEWSDGTGDYQPNWGKISLIDHKTDYAEHEFGEAIMGHAKHVHSCLMSWVVSAKSKAIPDGWVLAPIEPSSEMIANGHDAFVGAFDCKLNGGQSLHCAYKAMIQTLENSTQ